MCSFFISARGMNLSLISMHLRTSSMRLRTILRWCYTGQLATPTCNADSQRMFLARICRHVTLLNRFQKLATRCSTANIAKNRSQRAVTLEWFFAQHRIIASWRCKLTSVTPPLMHLRTSVMHLRTISMHLRTSLMHLRTTLTHLRTILMRLRTILMHLRTIFMHLRTSSMHLRTNLMHLRTSLMHLRTSSMHCARA